MGRTITPNAKKVKELREGRGWTQADLAKKSGRSERSIQKIEAGSMCYAFTLTKVAEALKVTFLDLVLEKKAEKPIPKGERRATIVVILDGDFDKFDETDQLEELLSKIASEMKAKAQIKVINVAKSSIKIELEMSESDIIRLLYALSNSKKLAAPPIGINEVRVTSVGVEHEGDDDQSDGQSASP